jgi:hypothetical protein
MAKKAVKGTNGAITRREDPPVSHDDSVKNGDKSAFFLRGLSNGVANDIAKLARDRGTSSNRLIVHIVENVFSRTELLALTLQDDGSVGSLQRFGDAFETLNWANRAFEKRFLSSAIAAYSKLVADPPERQLQGMAQLSRYLGGSTLIEIATQLEFRALQERRMPIFSDAERAVTLALALYEEYLSLEPSNVIMYNAACAYALLARIGIHSRLAQNNKELFACFRDIRFADADAKYMAMWQGGAASGNSDRDGAELECGDGIAQTWRNMMTADQVQRFERLANKSFESLEALLESRSTRNIIGPNVTDQGFWVEYAAEDSHLLFLRTDPTYSMQFTHWQETFYGRKEAIAPPLHALIEAETSLPRRIATRANQIANELLDRGSA